MKRMDHSPSSPATPSPRLDRWLAVVWAAALLWLAGLALVVHLHERPEDKLIFFSALALTGMLYPVFWFEAAWRARRSGMWTSSFTWSAALPITRIGVRDPIADGRIWLPKLGWRTCDEQLVKDVDRTLSTPMLLISLAVLPVVLVEYVYAEKLEAEPRLAQITNAATAVIWWAFTVEFVLMLSLTAKKLDYCKRHWLDIIIISLPIIYFLRALRLGRLLRLQSLSKTVRVYKLRGVLMRTYRALLLVDAITRLLHGGPEKRLEKLRRQLAEQETALAELRADIAVLEARILRDSTPNRLPDDLAA
jgi:hypothetical protein